MKMRFAAIGILGVVLSLGVLTTQTILGQNTLRFTGVNVTPERAVQLHWASNTNEVYEIDYADQLAGKPDGGTAWRPLYEDYPSHGTNTFWLDTGDYDNSSPPIPHPKNSPVRFYRIAMTGTNTGSNPTITIASPTNGAVVSGNLTITVSASSDQILMDPILYVDGQEMPPSDDGTNFVINTCEWWNGTHTLFAVAKSQSGMEGKINDSSITYGRAASPYVVVTFDNLISEFAFSEPLFEPTLGQTQQLTATFAANCDWTLQILDVNSNAVRTVTGRGISMQFNWDGTGDGGVSIPDGVYAYLLSAQTNGQAYQGSCDSGGNDGSGTPPFPSFASTASGESVASTELLAMPADGSGSAVPLILYPPGLLDTNKFIIFEGSMADVSPQRVSRAKVASLNTLNGGTAAPADANTPSAQSTTGPMRPPNKPVKGKVGIFGIAYQSYGPSGFSCLPPRTGWPYPLPVWVKLENFPVGSSVYLSPVTEYKWVARRLSWALQEAGWKVGFVKKDDELSLTDIEKSSLGGNSIFNTVDIGFLMGHGSYGSTAESDYVKYTYFFLGNAKNGAGPIRLADFDFGSGATNGLKWMTILACHMLNPTAFNSMKNNFRLPINENLHLLLGCTTVAYADARIGNQFGHRLAGSFLPMESVQNAWFDGGTRAYQLYRLAGISDTITFGVAGWPDCFNDSVLLYNYPDPQDGLNLNTKTVYSP